MCEVSPPAGTCHHSGAVSKADYQTLFSVLGLEAYDESPSQLFLGVWHDIVRRYSATNLCRSEDLLVAVEGLVTRIQQRSRLTYSFGLWREYLLLDMLWYVRRGRGIPTRGRAPSWSWASIEVQGPQIIYDPFTSVYPVAKITSLPELSQLQRYLIANGIDSNYSVKILGPLKHGVPEAQNRSPNPEQPYYYCRGIREDHPECPFHPDYELSDEVELSSLLFARISEAKIHQPVSEERHSEIGIVLTPTACGRYRRVGYFHNTFVTNSKKDSSNEQEPRPFFEDDPSMHEIEII